MTKRKSKRRMERKSKRKIERKNKRRSKKRMVFKQRKRSTRKQYLFEKYVPKKEIMMSNYESNGNMILGMRNLLEKVDLMQKK